MHKMQAHTKKIDIKNCKKINYRMFPNFAAMMLKGL